MNNYKLILSTTVGVGLMFGLAGCSGGDGLDEPLPAQTQKVPARMAATYAPSEGKLPIPNDILFGGTADLTLNIPVADAGDFSDPTVALNSLDGWSAVAPFAISFTSADSSLAISPASVVGGTSVHLYKVNVLRPEVIPGSGIIAPSGPVLSVERELTANLEYVVQATSATTIAIVPTVPFEQQASYMVVLTNGLMDTDGLPILHDAQYAIAKSKTPIDPASAVAGLEPIRQLVNYMEAAAAADGVADSSIILSFQFTVQSVGTVMDSAKLAYIDGPLYMGAVPQTSFSSLMTDTAPFTGIGAADLHKGSIALNYMLGVPSAENPIAPLNTFWKALQQLPIGPEGSLVDNPFGDNLTYANSYPRINAVETVPLLVSMPKAALCPKPATGYPVAIFQHGITGNRTNALGIVDALAAPPSCSAVVSMDQPLHGIAENDAVHQGLQLASGGFLGIFDGYEAGTSRERTFGVDYMDNATSAPGPDGIADGSGAHTINLSNLLVARDNSRQAIFDLLYLEKAIAYMDIDGDGADFDGNKISFIGHSLGGMVGTGMLAHSDNIKAAALVNPGGGIALMLDDSLAFGDRIRAGVAAGAGMAVTDPAFPALFAQFLFVTQTVIDSSDPVNKAARALTNNVPTLLMQVKDDSVIPNAVATAPLAGTEPLGRLLELTTVASAEPGLVAGSRLFTKLNQGLHSTVLSPADASGNPVGLLNVTIEMQTQIVTFLATVGAAIQVTDPTLLDD
ncbi:MAG: pimeloyl-ACP methyl ester carboxylesterase [Enterobacterales bacterium]|jgi:pimeloyl-ACP methyl ester carboxylesterase